MNLERDDTIEISININPSFRGKKLAVPIMIEAICYIQKNHLSVKRIVAEIKHFNIASIKTFKKVGFKFQNKLDKNGEIVYKFIYIMNDQFIINGKTISQENPTYIIAELSCNHNQDINLAYQLIDAAADSGADAIKLQTYTPDTMTLNCDKPIFKDCLKGTLWEGKTLYELYSKAYTPWEWHRDQKKYPVSI